MWLQGGKKLLLLCFYISIPKNKGSIMGLSTVTQWEKYYHIYITIESNFGWVLFLSRFENKGQGTYMLPKVTNLVSSRIRMWTQVFWLNQAFLVSSSWILSWESHDFLSNAAIGSTVKLGKSVCLLIEAE